MGSQASCCHDDAPEPPKELVEASHACEDPPEHAKGSASKAADVHTTVEVPSKWSRLHEMRQLEVDSEILRGITLRASLRGGGRLWRRSPLDLDDGERAQLWNKSRSVQHFDVFLSHTWHTPGKWKMLSLLMQAGWKWVIFLNGVIQVLMGILSVTEMLPLPFEYATQCPNFKTQVGYAPWALLLTFLSTTLGLLSIPYLPEGFATPLAWDAVCFLDAVCIHQTDTGLMERGIYGLGGFLRSSRELRVLWSRPYLSRLWCVFELAAYRFANPSGRITLAPLFVERDMALLIFGTFFACVLFNVFVVTGAFALFNPLVITMIYFVGLFPYIFVIHGLRRNISEKYHLLEELKYFDLDKAQTRSDFDRAFVHSAIVEWYGSKEAFVEYVRGPLREELLATESTGLPLAYALMTSMIPFSGAIDDFLALWRGGADVDCLLSTLIGFGVGLQICWIVATIRVVFFLVDRWAEPWWSGRADYLQTVLLYIVTYLWFMLGGITAQSACRADLWLAAVWSIAAFLVAFSLCGGCCWFVRLVRHGALVARKGGDAQV